MISAAAYSHDLLNLGAALALEAERARRRGLFGLADRLTEAADSAISWAHNLEADDGP